MNVFQHFEIGLRVLGLEVYDLAANHAVHSAGSMRDFFEDPNPQSCSPPQCTELGAGACRRRIRCAAWLCEWKQDAASQAAAGGPKLRQSGFAPVPRSL